MFAMKRCYYSLLTLISTIIICLSLAPYAAAANTNDAEMEMRQTEVMHHGRLPEGLIMHHGRIMLKRGYSYRQVSMSRVNVISPLKGNVTGSLECRCKLRGGRCRIMASPHSVYCSRRYCPGKCSLRINTPQVTIMGGEYMGKHTDEDGSGSDQDEMMKRPQ